MWFLLAALELLMSKTFWKYVRSTHNLISCYLGSSNFELVHFNMLPLDFFPVFVLYKKYVPVSS